MLVKENSAVSMATHYLFDSQQIIDISVISVHKRVFRAIGVLFDY